MVSGRELMNRIRDTDDAPVPSVLFFTASYFVYLNI